MLDVDQEFDQSFEAGTAKDGASPAGRPASLPAAPSGHTDPSPSARSGPPAALPAAGGAAQSAAARANAPEVSGPAEPRGKDPRSAAESAYQRIADEILESTREVCQRLISDGEKALERAKFLQAEAEQTREQVIKELEAAKALRAEAEAFRAKSLSAVSEAQKQGQDILGRARVETDSQLVQIRLQATAEAEKVVAEARAVRAAAQEEMQAQKLYTEAARLKAESNEALSQLRQQMGALLASPVRGASQARPGPSQPQNTGPQPAVPTPVATPAPVAALAPVQSLTPRDQPSVTQLAPGATPRQASVDQAAPPAAPKAEPQTKPPVAKPPVEDNALSRKKAGRWFGLGG